MTSSTANMDDDKVLIKEEVMKEETPNNSDDLAQDPPLSCASIKGETEEEASDVKGEEEEDVDEEENFLCAIEQEKENVETEQSKGSNGVQSAPKLLQEALNKGQVKDEESKKPADTEKTEISSKTEEDKEEEKKEESNPYNARANQLDFLLSKASEYSNFIAADLEELQTAMAEDAKNATKKRKGSSSKKGGKKSKKNDGTALKNAIDKHDAHVGSQPIFIQPHNLASGCVLKDYQLEGVRWLTSLFENGVSGILADEMGLGKTIQVIAMIAHLRTMQVPGPFLIVAPLATLPNWVREFEKWLPSLPVIRFHGTAPEREEMLRGPLNPKSKRSNDFPAIVTSYEISIKEWRKLNRIGEYTYLVVDEGQRLKNHRCTLIQSLKRIAASNRLLLSGTPIQNNLDELWSLLNFVNPTIFDDLSVFQSWFRFRDIGQKHRNATDEEAILMEQRQNNTVSKLHEILRPFLLRRIKKDVLSDMPPKKEVVVYAGMSKLQTGYADLIEQGTLRDILLNQGIEAGRNLSQVNKMMNHRKNANHPFLFGEPFDPATGVHLGTAHPQLLVRASGKFALLDRMLERLHKDKHQVLIFSQMTRLLNVIEDYLLWRNWKYCRIDGNTKIDERQRQMDVFNAEKTNGEGGTRNDNDDRFFVFMLSTRAGGLGINLASADTCIIFDSDWNPHQDSQAMDRCHRIGQTRPVAVYRYLTANSVDIDMMEKQISKKKLERMAIVGGDFRKAGSRSRGNFSAKNLNKLLEDDIKDLHAKGGDIESIKIDDEEFDSIMDRKKLFAEGADAIPQEGKMYDIVEANNGGGVLGGVA
jgi:ATP-dependent DNA helicase